MTSIRNKIFAGYLVLLILMVANGLLSYTKLSRIMQENKLNIENILSAIKIDALSQNKSMWFFDFNTANDTFKQMVLNTSEYVRNGDERFSLLYAKAFKNATAVTGVVEDIGQQYESHHRRSKKILTAAGNRLLFFMAVAVVLGTAIGLFLAKRITDPMKGVMQTSKRIANGDLKQLTRQLTSLSNGDVRLKFTDTSLAVASGGLSVRVEPQSGHDVLGGALSLMAENLGGLAAGMAHEVNPPLAGMIQNACVLKSRLGQTDMPANLAVADELGISMADIRSFMEKRGTFRMIDAILAGPGPHRLFAACSVLHGKQIPTPFPAVRIN